MRGEYNTSTLSLTQTLTLSLFLSHTHTHTHTPTHARTHSPLGESFASSVFIHVALLFIGFTFISVSNRCDEPLAQLHWAGWDTHTHTHTQRHTYCTHAYTYLSDMIDDGAGSLT